MKKYELIKEAGTSLLRLQTLRSFGDVKIGDLGGLVESEANLSQDGNAWVYGNAMVCGDAKVYGNANGNYSYYYVIETVDEIAKLLKTKKLL